MPLIQLIEVIDEFEFTAIEIQVDKDRGALDSLEDVALVHHEESNCYVSLHAQGLTLWNPELHWADQGRRRFDGPVEDAVAVALAWLARYLDVTQEEINLLLDLEEFE